MNSQFTTCVIQINIVLFFLAFVAFQSCGFSHSKSNQCLFLVSTILILIQFSQWIKIQAFKVKLQKCRNIQQAINTGNKKENEKHVLEISCICENKNREREKCYHITLTRRNVWREKRKTKTDEREWVYMKINEGAQVFNASIFNK